ncbi:phytanoyl-CoA dioxygenase family protein [uncultured Nostoc sp.]|uniref:phytanoyl-CoA dioxygenase family protein n=1 Tax=uncultured Nostoc sp. TaxID=340711 RepID=UPI0035CB0382
MSKATILQDPYPTRLVNSQPELISRVDPVVWTDKRGQGPLTDEQLDFYEANGYLVIPQVFSSEEIDIYRQEMLDFKTNFEIKQQDVRVTETVKIATEPGTGALRSIYEAHTVTKLFARLSRDKRLVEPSRQILNDEVYIHQSRINFQQGYVGQGFYWHQGFETWHSEDGMPKMRALTCMVFLDKNLAQNGALMVVPGSHKNFIPCMGKTPEKPWEQSLSQSKYTIAPDQSMLAEVINQHGIEYCSGEPGTLVVLDCNVLHGSHSNISPWSRLNVLYVYNSIENSLGYPYEGLTYRPEHLATRNSISPIVLE